MKPTKARLRNYVDTLKNSVEKEIRAKKTKAIRAHIESEWLKIDPEFENYVDISTHSRFAKT